MFRWTPLSAEKERVSETVPGILWIWIVKYYTNLKPSQSKSIQIFYFIDVPPDHLAYIIIPVHIIFVL